jgi:hypothetical protein
LYHSGVKSFIPFRKSLSFAKISIKKILKVDYPRGRAKGYYANFISAKKPKIEFSLFHPSDSLWTAISPKFQGRIYGTPRQSLEELFD